MNFSHQKNYKILILKLLLEIKLEFSQNGKIYILTKVIIS